MAEVGRERDELEKALASLTGRRSRPQSPSRSRRSKGQRATRGQRQTEFLKAIGARPRAPMAEIAREMGVPPQQLYPIARRLKSDGLIAKRNGGYVAKEGAKARATAKSKS